MNLAPVPRPGYRVGLPRSGTWREVLNTDERRFGGSGMTNGSVEAEGVGWHNEPCSASVDLPPLGVVWLTPERR
jgi:1,4-alpha-glucan branching enzyme